MKPISLSGKGSTLKWVRSSGYARDKVSAMMLSLPATRDSSKLYSWSRRLQRIILAEL